MRRLLWLALPLALALPASAQTPTPDSVPVQWTVFVGGPGRRGERTNVSNSAGNVRMADTAWRCGYAVPRVAAISATDYSVQRILACQRERATVSATASCRVQGGQIQEHAATLSLGTVDERDYVTVTLGCQRRR